VTVFRLLATVMLIALASFTAVVVAHHGLDLLPIFFGDMAAGGWPGQFNADFLTFLTLSALWTAWRNSFRPSGIMLGAVAFFLGGAFLLTYLLYLSWKAQGGWAEIMLGDHYKSGN
jgi:hypothetical protein